ncbi:MAG: glutamine amidotransferase class-I, partial [uncultured bacterium]
MSVHDTEVYPWLRKEKEFISKAIKSGKIMLGICLGAQLIADVLGAKVKKAKEKEIGWFKIKLSDNIKTNYLCKIFPDDFIAFHWHGEEFELPDNAINIG